MLLAGAAGAQVSPDGPEFQVNSYTTGNQYRPAIAADASGGFVVVWTSFGSSGTDTDGSSIQAQRYDAAGFPLGGQFQVNTYAMNQQSYPAIAADASGNFVVAWTSDGSSGTDSSYTSIQAQRYDAAGFPLGGQFQVNTYTINQQADPAVAADAFGNFVVAWRSYGSSGTDSSYTSIQAQRYDAAGVPLGGQFQVNTYTTGSQWYPTVAVAASGDFVVAWQSPGSSGPDTYSSIQAQRYDAAGAPLGGEFQVNTFTTSTQKRPAAAADAAGNFVVVWSSFGSSWTDTNALSIQAQRYDATGTPLGGEFQVNTYTTNNQRYPAVAADAAGNFVVSWESTGSFGTDTSSSSVQARRYDAAGAPLGGEFQVNTYTMSVQWNPAVAADATGNFVVAWESDGSSGTDTSSLSIQARRYDGLFRDGFESGDPSRWSAAVP